MYPNEDYEYINAELNECLSHLGRVLTNDIIMQNPRWIMLIATMRKRIGGIQTTICEAQQVAQREATDK